MSLVRPSVRSSVIARPDAPHGNLAIVTLRAVLLSLRLGQAAPRQLRIGEHDRRNRPRLERHVLAGNHFDRDAPFVRRLVRQHRLADDVADGEDRRLVGAQLLVDDDEAALVDLDACAVEPGNLRIRPAADRHQHAIEHLLLRRRPSRPRLRR